MHFRIEGHRFRGLELATVVAGAAFFFSPVQSLAIEPPFGQARAIIQEMLGEAITEDALARTAGEKGRAQEKLGLIIANDSLLKLGESPIGMGGEVEPIVKGP